MNLEDQLQALIDSSPPHIQRHFACDCAQRALKAAKVKDKRPWRAIEVGSRYAEGAATSEELDAARDAAESAARSARYAARSAWYAARSASYARSASSARSARSAWYATRSAWYVAWNAAGSAAEYAERQWQLAHLQSMISNHNEARSSLLYILQQRAESIKPVFVQYARSLEERVFE